MCLLIRQINPHHALCHFLPLTNAASSEILAPIGRGGMGDVYRTRDTNLTRDVAIWVLVRLPAMRR